MNCVPKVLAIYLNILLLCFLFLGNACIIKRRNVQTLKPRRVDERSETLAKSSVKPLALGSQTRQGSPSLPHCLPSFQSQLPAASFSPAGTPQLSRFQAACLVCAHPDA